MLAVTISLTLITFMYYLFPALYYYIYVRFHCNSLIYVTTLYIYCIIYVSLFNKQWFNLLTRGNGVRFGLVQFCFIDFF